MSRKITIKAFKYNPLSKISLRYLRDRRDRRNDAVYRA